MPQLKNYLERIHYTGSLDPCFQTLADIHHAHLLNIPYENGDVQLGKPLDFDIERIYHKLVIAKRGGWCYEMNGLLGWALNQIGFQVTRMSGAVMRASLGDAQLGNHLILEVMLDDVPFLADVGLGDGIRFPIPIREHQATQQGLTYGLEKLPDGFWRFHNHERSNVSSFDFRHQPADEAELADKCAWLQSDPSSMFRQVFIVNRFTPSTVEILLGKMRTTITGSDKHSHELASYAAFEAELNRTFGINIDMSPVWSQIEAVHEEMLRKRAAD